MKIWIDIKDLDNKSLYYKFIITQLTYLIEKSENEYIIYSYQPIILETEKKYINEVIKKESCKIKEQLSQYNKFKWDKLDLIIYTSIIRPILYKNKSLFILDSLKEYIYPEEKEISTIIKNVKKIFFNNILKKSDKIIVLDSNTKDTLNEVYNVNENKINLLKPFFLENQDWDKVNNIDVKLKYNIKNNYIIYEWWSWSNKNIPRLIESVNKVNSIEEKIDLIIFWNKGIDNQINKIINKKIKLNNIHIVIDLDENSKLQYYKNSIWTILPSLYESFPFMLSNAVKYNTNIIASDIKPIKEIFKNNIEYFNPLSTNSIVKWIENILKNKEATQNYKLLTDDYNKINSTNSLIDIINEI